MKKILTLFSVVMLFSSLNLSANNGIQPLADNEIQFNEVSTLPANTQLYFTPESNGTFKIFYLNLNSIFYEYLYDTNETWEMTATSWKKYASASSEAIYTQSPGTEVTYTLEAGTAYYLENDSALEYYAVFEAVSDEVAEIELDQPITLAIGQKAVFHCGFTGELQVDETSSQGEYVYSTTRSFLYSDEDCTQPVIATSSAFGAYSDTFVFNVTAGQDYYLCYNSSLEKGNITFTFIQKGAQVVPVVEFDKEVNYVKDTEYQINVDGPCQIAITTSIQLGESELMYGMISYKTSGVNRRISEYSVEQDGSNYKYIYTLSNPNNPTEDTYYFICQVTGDYTFSIYVPEDVEPSTAVAKIDYPETDVKNFSSLIIVWGNYENITNGSLLGATITFPNKETYPMTKYTIGPAKDGQTADNSLTVMFDPVAEADGVYSIYLPKGVVKIDGLPNKEQTLTFNHKWVPETLPSLGDVVNSEITSSDNAVQVSWDEFVTLALSTFEIPVTYNGNSVGSITSPDYLELTTVATEAGIAPMAEVGDRGNVLNILYKEAPGIYQGAGNYTFALPQGLVDADGFVNAATTIAVTVTDKVTGVDTIGVNEAEAEYYNLQGVKVAAPANGLYIKVVNGKASKVMVRK